MKKYLNKIELSVLYRILNKRDLLVRKPRHWKF